jgi:hypothetical protein
VVVGASGGAATIAIVTALNIVQTIALVVAALVSAYAVWVSERNRRTDLRRASSDCSERYRSSPWRR